MKVGITGHRELSNTESNWLAKEFVTEIDNIEIDESYSSLAIGTDQLFATIIISRAIKLVAIIPSKNYETTFKVHEITAYERLLALCEQEIQLDFEQPTDESFYEAGKTIVDKSNLLFACWDSLPAKGLGGTADIVTYPKKLSKKIIHFNPLTKTKKYINY